MYSMLWKVRETAAPRANQSIGVSFCSASPRLAALLCAASTRSARDMSELWIRKIKYLELYSGIDIRVCFSHRVEDFTGRKSCFLDSRTEPVYRFLTFKMTRMSKPIRQKISSVRIFPGFYFSSRPLTEIGASPKRQQGRY